MGPRFKSGPPQPFPLDAAGLAANLRPSRVELLAPTRLESRSSPLLTCDRPTGLPDKRGLGHRFRHPKICRLRRGSKTPGDAILGFGRRVTPKGPLRPFFCLSALD